MTKAKIGYPKICEYCHEPFTAFRKGSRYCKKICNNRAYREGAQLKKHSEVKEVDVVKVTAARTNILLEDILTEVSNINKQLSLSAKPYLTPKETCALLDISRKSFDRIVQMGTLKIFQLGQGKLYVKRSDIDLAFETTNSKKHNS